MATDSVQHKRVNWLKHIMSKANKTRNHPNNQTVKTPKSGNPLENYFDSDSSKKRKMSNLDLSSDNGSPPTKKLGKDSSPKKGRSPTNDRSPKQECTPTSDKVCKHLDTQLSDMEKRLETSLSTSLSSSISACVTSGLKNLIDSSLKEALTTMSNKVNEVIDEHPTIVHHGEQIDSLETENLLLKSKVNQMEDESSHIKRRLVNIESRALSNNLIVRGISEDAKERESTTRNKVYTELITLITCDSEDPNEQLKEAKKLEIRSCKRLGRYVKDRAHPISVEFVRKDDVDFILSNKTNLAKGVFADKEYPAEVEKKRKILRPIYTAAKHSTKYRKRCRMENDLLVVKGKRYNVNELDNLPKSLKPANVTSKNSKTVYGYFGELNPSPTSSQPPSPTKPNHFTAVNNSSSTKRLNCSKIKRL